MTTTFKRALVGRDVANEIRNLRRRARYAQQQDRPKTFANTRTTDLYCGYWTRGQCYTADHASRDLATLKTATDTAAYVSAWCRLNNLKEC